MNKPPAFPPVLISHIIAGGRRASRNLRVRQDKSLISDRSYPFVCTSFFGPHPDEWRQSIGNSLFSNNFSGGRYGRR